MTHGFAYRIRSLKTNLPGDYGGAHFGTIPGGESGVDFFQGDDFRALLIQTPRHNILFDPGPGGYCLGSGARGAGYVGDNVLFLEALGAQGISPQEITHVILSHLHYDTAGGILPGKELGSKKCPIFENARIFVSRANYDRARTPHVTDKKRFIPGICEVLENSRELVFIGQGDVIALDDVCIEFHETQGHSPGMILADIHYKDHCIITGADLLPGSQWLDLTRATGNDRFWEKLVDEKKAILDLAVKKNAWVFYPNDLGFAFSKITFDSGNGKYLATAPSTHLPDR